jgi:hypothetical protein
MSRCHLDSAVSVWRGLISDLSVAVNISISASTDLSDARSLSIFRTAAMACVVLTVIEAADLRIAPAAHMPRKVHRDVSAEYGSGAVVPDAPRPQIILNRGLNLLERNRPDPNVCQSWNRHFNSPLSRTARANGDGFIQFEKGSALRYPRGASRPVKPNQIQPQSNPFAEFPFPRILLNANLTARVLPDQRAESAAVHSPDSSAT